MWGKAGSFSRSVGEEEQQPGWDGAVLTLLGSAIPGQAATSPQNQGKSPKNRENPKNQGKSQNPGEIPPKLGKIPPKPKENPSKTRENPKKQEKSQKTGKIPLKPKENPKNQGKSLQNPRKIPKPREILPILLIQQIPGSGAGLWHKKCLDSSIETR